MIILLCLCVPDLDMLCAERRTQEAAAATRISYALGNKSFLDFHRLLLPALFLQYSSVLVVGIGRMVSILCFIDLAYSGQSHSTLIDHVNNCLCSSHSIL